MGNTTKFRKKSKAEKRHKQDSGKNNNIPKKSLFAGLSPSETERIVSRHGELDTRLVNLEAMLNDSDETKTRKKKSTDQTKADQTTKAEQAKYSVAFIQEKPRSLEEYPCPVITNFKKRPPDIGEVLVWDAYGRGNVDAIVRVVKKMKNKDRWKLDNGCVMDKNGKVRGMTRTYVYRSPKMMLKKARLTLVSFLQTYSYENLNMFTLQQLSRILLGHDAYVEARTKHVMQEVMDQEEKKRREKSLSKESSRSVMSDSNSENKDVDEDAEILPKSASKGKGVAKDGKTAKLGKSARNSTILSRKSTHLDKKNGGKPAWFELDL